MPRLPLRRHAPKYRRESADGHAGMSVYVLGSPSPLWNILEDATDRGSSCAK